MTRHVVVGMSGGVDSSVTALQLVRAGYHVTGLFMKNWDEDDDTGYCTAPQDFADAQQVCDRLGIALKSVNFATEYWDAVFEVFLSEYCAGRTPNPDILCNKHVKFRAFLDYSQDLGGHQMATGHYARIDCTADGYRLLKGLDPGKDQSYFLYTLNQQQLAHSQFPIGHLAKTDVRQMAAAAGFGNARKKDSTGICFIGERRFRDFLQRYVPAQPGVIETACGQVIGEHAGLMYFTIGQRQGLGIGGVPGAPEQPWYVLDKDLTRNVLIVGQGHDHPRLFHNCLTTDSLDWISGRLPQQPFACSAKTRYRQTDQPCIFEPLEQERCRVWFNQPQRAITPGQSVVFYLGDECLGGAVIETAQNRSRPAALDKLHLSA